MCVVHVAEEKSGSSAPPSFSVLKELVVEIIILYCVIFFIEEQKLEVLLHLAFTSFLETVLSKIYSDIHTSC